MDLNWTNLDEKQLKRFGLIFGPLAVAISCWQATKGHWGHVVVLGPLGTYALIMALVRPAWVKPVHVLMAGLFKALMWVVTHVFLTLCFYCVFAPIGLIMRLCGKDLLDQKFDEHSESYWHERKMQDFDPHHYLKQF